MRLTVVQTFDKSLGNYLKNATDVSLALERRIFILISRKHFISIPNSGAARTSLISQEGRLDLIHRKRSCQPIGTHLSPRSVSV